MNCGRLRRQRYRGAANEDPSKIHVAVRQVQQVRAALRGRLAARDGALEMCARGGGGQAVLRRPSDLSNMRSHSMPMAMASSAGMRCENMPKRWDACGVAQIAAGQSVRQDVAGLLEIVIQRTPIQHKARAAPSVPDHRSSSGAANVESRNVARRNA
jgi:hypothetical protein